MKLKTLAALCKKQGSFYLYDQVNADGEVTGQWLGMGGATYPLSGLPFLTEENLVALFDITEKQRESMYFNRSTLPETLNFSDADADEVMLERESITLGYSGRIVRPLITRGGLEFIDNDYLSPLADVADMMEIYERRTPSGGTFFALKTGLMIAGVVMPLNIIEERLVRDMEELAYKSRAALDLKMERERQAAEREQESGQTKFETEDKGDDD